MHGHTNIKFIFWYLCIDDDDDDDDDDNDDDDDDCHGGLSALLTVKEAKVKRYSSCDITMI